MFTFSNFKKGLKHQINGTTTRRDFDYPTRIGFDDDGDEKKVCVVCGRRIRTGWKYCHEHRNTKSSSKKKGFQYNYGLSWVGAMLLFLGLIVTSKNLYGLILIIIGLLLLFLDYKMVLLRKRQWLEIKR